ncbi:MAG: Phosphoenolpyruvate-protein phosphotransferase [Chlamydiae bacterium]|nr:Phosphoenolpyruvate-protein phosphotransferase [Chlamydiota bacterium]
MEGRKKGIELHLKGYPICPGVAIARPFFFQTPEENVPEFSVPHEKIDDEVKRYYRALKNSRKDLLFLQTRLKKEGGVEAADILDSHIEMMRDPMMTEQVEEEIRSKKKNTEYAFKSVILEYEQKFSKINDNFFQERVKDFQDISRRVIGHLRKVGKCSLTTLSRACIVFAHELSPSNTVEARTDLIEAFVTRSGAETSHVAIIARAKGIPFVSNVDFPDLSLSLPPQVIVDGEVGEVIINPNKETIRFFQQKIDQRKSEIKGLRKSRILAPSTSDGVKMHLSANVEMDDDYAPLLEYGAEGIGLFRTEYLYLAHDTFPSEDEQFLVYKKMVESVGEYASIIRTFDIGGDKLGNVHISRYEKNPYLGCRAIRLMLRERAIFKTQIRAILRASAFGELAIIFPMISGVAELRSAKEVIEEVKSDLLQEGVPFARKIPIGCMIEVPSAAVTADLLAKECDFFSIGTNDLVQYALAVDRGNPSMSYLYNPADPSILRMIKMVVDEAKKANIAVSVCGEVAADPHFVPLLLGMGIHELSLSPSSIPIIKNVIRHLSIVEAQKLAAHALTLTTPLEVEEALLALYQTIASRFSSS